MRCEPQVLELSSREWGRARGWQGQGASLRNLPASGQFRCILLCGARPDAPLPQDMRHTLLGSTLCIIIRLAGWQSENWVKNSAPDFENEDEIGVKNWVKKLVKFSAAVLRVKIRTKRRQTIPPNFSPKFSPRFRPHFQNLARNFHPLFALPARQPDLCVKSLLETQG